MFTVESNVINIKIDQLGATQYRVALNSVSDEPWLDIEPYDNGKYYEIEYELPNKPGYYELNIQLRNTRDTSPEYKYEIEYIRSYPDQDEETAIFRETMGTISISTPWPTVDNYKGWSRTGTAVSTVSYNGSNVTIQRDGDSNVGTFDKASGPNMLVFNTAPATFTINRIKLKSSQTKLRFSFSGMFKKTYEESIDTTFYSNKFKVSISGDLENWVDVNYSITGSDSTPPYWIRGIADFTLLKAVGEVYIRLTADESDAFRIDDLIFEEGNGGQIIDLEGAPDPDPDPDPDPEYTTNTVGKLYIYQIYAPSSSVVNVQDGVNMNHCFISLYNNSNETLDLSDTYMFHNSWNSRWLKSRLVGTMPPKSFYLIKGINCDLMAGFSNLLDWSVKTADLDLSVDWELYPDESRSDVVNRLNSLFISSKCASILLHKGDFDQDELLPDASNAISKVDLFGMTGKDGEDPLAFENAFITGNKKSNLCQRKLDITIVDSDDNSLDFDKVTVYSTAIGSNELNSIIKNSKS